MNREAFESYVDALLARAGAKLIRFSESIASDPGSALEVSEEVFEAAACRRVFGLVKHRLGQGAAVEQIIALATVEARNHARWPSRSTSITSNLMHQCAGAVWGEIASWDGAS